MLFSTRLGGTSGGAAASYVRALIGLRKAQTRSCTVTRSWKTIKTIIEKGLARNTPELREQVLNLAYAHYTNASTDGETLSRLVAFFNGLPGTGKSRAAKIVAEAFGFPVATLKLPGLSPKELWGAGPSDGNSPGALTMKVIELGCDTGVIIVEDIDHALEGGLYSRDMATSLLDVFDTTQRSFLNPFLQTQVGTAKILMLLTGNSKFTKDALSDRVDMVDFVDYSPETKLAIVLEDFLPRLLQEKGIASEKFASALPLLKEELLADNSTGLRTREKLVKNAVAKFSRSEAED
jgi:ATP-dependent Lon protease